MSQQPSDDSQRLRILTCPSCGAALPGSHGRVECAYCGTVVEFRKNSKTAVGSPAAASHHPAATPRSNTPVRAAQLGGCVALVIALIALGTLAFFGFFAWASLRTVNLLDVPPPTSTTEQTAFPERDPVGLTSTNMLLALPLGDVPTGSQPRSIALVYSQDDQQYHLALLDMAKQQRVWVGPPLSKEALGYGKLAASADTVVFADQQILYGFALKDGTKRWSSQLSDRVCDACMIITKDTAVVLSIDSMLTGVDLSSGERLWSHDLGKYAGQELLQAGDQVLVLARDADSHGQVTLIDPASGQTAQQFIPACSSKTFADQQIYAYPSDLHWLSPDRQTIMFISYSIDTCLHAYDLATGEQRWETVLTDRFDLRDSTLLVSGTDLLAASENQILAIDQASGELRVAFENEDYTFHPLALRDGVLATIAVKQRGTERVELWGVDPQSGKRLWRHEFAGDGKMLEPPYQAYGVLEDTSELWALSDTSAGLVLATLTAKPHRYTFELLDAKSGQTATTTTLDLPATDTVWVPEVVSRSGDLLYVEQQSALVGINVVKGSIVYQGP